MNYLTESDYSELIDHLISGLQQYHADDIIRQIKELETVSIIEEAQPAPASAAKKAPVLNQIGLWEQAAVKEDAVKPAKKADKKQDKKVDREAVSEYRSRPVSCKEMYDASIGILETCLFSVPKILEGIEKSLHLDGLSSVAWETESMRHAEDSGNLVEAAGSLKPEVRQEMEESIEALRNGSGKDIKEEINRLLELASGSQLLSVHSDTVGRAYAAYIWSLCRQAVEEAGGCAVLTGIKSGQNPKRIVLRSSPGSMASTSQDFCYINCQLNGKEFEIHLDVQYEGSSGASHEVDVSICDHASAEAVRGNGGLPRSGKLIMAAACRFYMSSVPSAAQGRGFAGLVRDCPGTLLNAFVSNRASANLDKYFSNKSNIEPFTDLEPGRDAAADRFIRIIEQALRKWSK